MVTPTSFRLLPFRKNAAHQSLSVVTPHFPPRPKPTSLPPNRSQSHNVGDHPANTIRLATAALATRIAATMSGHDDEAQELTVGMGKCPSGHRGLG